MDLKRLRSFREVAESGSLSRASDRLRLAQPALSRQIALVEAEIGLPLFTRHGRGMALTEAGRELLARVVGPIRQLEQAVEEVRALAGSVGGQVSLGMMPTVAAVLAGPLARSVAAQFPEISLRIVEGYTGHLVEWVQRGATDATLLYGPGAEMSLKVEPLFVEDLVLAAPAGEPLAGGGPVTLAALARRPLVLPSRTHGLRAVVEAAAAKARVTLDIRYEADSFAVLKELVEAGLGLSVIPRSSIAREVREGRFAIAALHRPRVRRAVMLAMAPDRAPGRAARAVLEVLRAEVAARAAAGDWHVMGGA